jgi:putative SOS response-associated peptidase YedK
VHRSFAIMTTTPNAEMDELHDRMPVILEEQDWPVWLAEAEGDHRALLRPAPDGTLRTWPVDRRVGSPRNNGPELLEAGWRDGSVSASWWHNVFRGILTASGPVADP